jgi:hypothetical protein
MKRALQVLGFCSLVGLFGIVAVVALFWWIDSPYPSDSTVRTWEDNYRSEVASNIEEFQGHWLTTDIGAYIYSYHHKADSVTSHQSQLINRLPDFTVHSRSDNLLVLRQSVTYSRPDGYNEWRFLFDDKTAIVTVLYANLDSELSSANWLKEKAREYHNERRQAEQAAP